MSQFISSVMGWLRYPMENGCVKYVQQGKILQPPPVNCVPTPEEHTNPWIVLGNGSIHCVQLGSQKYLSQKTMEIPFTLCLIWTRNVSNWSVFCAILPKGPLSSAATANVSLLLILGVLYECQKKVGHFHLSYTRSTHEHTLQHVFGHILSYTPFTHPLPFDTSYHNPLKHSSLHLTEPSITPPPHSSVPLNISYLPLLFFLNRLHEAYYQERRRGDDMGDLL